MSTDSLAIFRRHLGPELGALAEEHLKHDLRQSDRDALQSAASTVSLYTSLGTAVGVSLGLVLAYRIRSSRARLLTALRTADQPVALRFADGREQALPDLRPHLRPRALGDVAAYVLLGAGGLFFGGESGLLIGTLRARAEIGKDRDRRERVQRAFRRFQADALRVRAEGLERMAEGGL